MFFKRICLILSIVVCLTNMQQVSAATMDEKAANIQLKSLTGETTALKDVKGEKAVVHFFATWCHPCQEEMPYIVSFAKRVQEEGAAFIPVHLTQVDSELEQLHSFLTYYQANFDPLLDKEGEMMNTYSIVGIPTTLFLDENGQVEKRINGMLPQEAAETFLKQIKLKEGS